MSNKLFTQDGKMEDVSVPKQTETTVFIGLINDDGSENALDFGGGVITVATLSEVENKYIPLKTFENLDSKVDKASRFILPAEQKMTVILSGSTSPNIYAEIKTGADRP
jgi:hypothetical protein